MKKIMFMICALAAVAVACTSETKEVPAVSFETAIPVTSGEIATFKIAVADYSGTDPVSIPVTFGGTAVKGTDYIVSAEEFVWGGENPVTSIQVTTLVFDESKTVSLTLDIPEGWKAGNYPMSEMNLSAKLGYVSFERSALAITGTSEIVVSIYNGAGQTLKLENDAELPIIVAESSTAQENTHFTLSTKTVKIPAGSSSASFTVSIAGDEAVADHDKIVLALDPGAKFSIGNYDEIAITIWGSAWSKLNGTWQIVEVSPEATGMWGDMVTGMDQIPTVVEGDGFTVDIEEMKFVPNFQSAFCNYFIGESNIAKDMLITDFGQGVGNKISLQLVSFDNTNRYFSSAEQSEDKVSLVGIAFEEGETAGDEILRMYIVDHTSKSFMPELLDFGMYLPEKPVAVDYGNFISAAFKKVN